MRTKRSLKTVCSNLSREQSEFTYIVQVGDESLRHYATKTTDISDDMRAADPVLHTV